MWAITYAALGPDNFLGVDPLKGTYDRETGPGARRQSEHPGRARQLALPIDYGSASAADWR